MEDREGEAGRSSAEFQRSDKVEVPMEDRERSSAELQGGGAVRKVPSCARSLAETKKAQRLCGGAWRCASVAWSWSACRIGLLALILTIGGLLLLALIAASVLYMLQDTVLYHPPRLSMPVPSEVLHKSIFVRAKDGVRLNLILLRHAPGPGPAPGPAPTVIYFHGNAENIGDCVYYAQRMRVDLKVNVVVLDYRGYGESEGEPSEEGLRLDAEAALDYVVNGTDLNKTKVVLLGRSLGGAVAVRLASENPHRVAALVLENTFLSIQHVAATFFLPLGHLPLWCYKNKFLSYQHVTQCHMPTLFLSGLSDRLIPPEMMKRLYELSPSQTKRMAVFPNGTHNNTSRRPGYLAALEQFIKDLLMSHAHQEAAEGAANITI